MVKIDLLYHKYF